MGRLLIAFLVLFTSLISLCQDKQRKNELGFSMFKVSTTPFFNYSIPYPLMPNVGANVVFKHKIYDNFYFRASQSYYKYSLDDYGYTCYDCTNNKRKVQEINTSAGFEFRYFGTKSGKFVLYSGFDASFFIHQSNSMARDFGPGSSKFKQKNTGLGIQGFTGLSIYPTKKLVFSIDGSLLIGYYKQKNSSSDMTGFVRSSSEDIGSQPYAQFFLIRSATIGWRF